MNQGDTRDSVRLVVEVPGEFPSADLSVNAQLPTFARADSGGVAHEFHMAVRNWRPSKPYDLRERLFEFGCLIVRLVQFLYTQGPAASALSYQLLKAGTSAGANYEEADDNRNQKRGRLTGLGVGQSSEVGS